MNTNEPLGPVNFDPHNRPLKYMSSKDDRVFLALEWLTMQAESNGKGYVNGADIHRAASLFCLPNNDSDEESLCQLLFRAVLKGDEAA